MIRGLRNTQYAPSFDLDMAAAALAADMAANPRKVAYTPEEIRTVTGIPAREFDAKVMLPLLAERIGAPLLEDD